MNLRDYDRMPTIGAAMTPFPRFVTGDTPISEVEELMASLGIRHVPVQEEGRVVGVVSKPEVGRLVGPSSTSADKQTILARDAMTHDPYVTEIGTPLAQVLHEMARRQLGSAVVLKHGKLAGIFSTTDACAVLAHVLDERFPPGDPDDAA